MRYSYKDMTAALIVDDDPDVRALLGFTLSDEGFDIREAPDGTSAIDALADSQPDCMVLDVMMPGLDGFGVLRAMRAKQLGRNTRVLMLTCRSEDRDYVRGFDLGAHDYLTKPFEPEMLVSRLRNLLEESAPDLEYKRRQELQRSMLLDRLQTTFARQSARRLASEPHPVETMNEGVAPGSSPPLPLRWRLGG